MDTYHWKKSVILILNFLGGVTLAEYGWRPRQEYKFSVEGRSLAGVTSLSEQYTGIHYRGVLKVQSQSSNVLAMVLQNMSYTKVHEELQRGWWGTLPENEDNYMTFPMTESTFMLQLDKGVIEGLFLRRNLPDWQVNFIQGIASKLQLDLSGSNVIHGSKGNSIPGRSNKAADVFFTMEDSVMGRCEVLYEVSQLPRLKNEVALELCGSRPFLEISKTLNHSNCEVNPEYHFGLPHNLRCHPGGNQCGQFWTRATVSRIIGCGSRDDMLFLSSTSSNRIVANLNFHNSTQASVNSYLNLTLISARPLSKRLTPPENAVTIRNLMYKYTNPDAEAETKPSKPKSKKSKKDHNEGSLESSEERVPKRRPKRKSSKKHHSHPHKDSGELEEKIQYSPSIMESAERGMWNHPANDDILPPPMPFDGFALAHCKAEERACLGQQLKEMVSDIASDLESWYLDLEKSTLEKVALAIRVCRCMTYAELVKTIGIHMDSQLRNNRLLKTERKVFRDIITMCGTNPAFKIIKSWIEEQKLEGEEAASVISSLPSHLISPNGDILDQFYEMMRSPAMKEDPKLRTTSVLAFSNLLRTTCVSRMERQLRYPYHVTGEECKAERAARYLPYMNSQLRGDPALRPAFLMALGNTGSLLALPALSTTANDPSASPYLRARAIIAMKHLVLKEPRTMAPILLALYDNKQAPELVRLTSVSMLFFSKPTLSMWQKIATGTWFEQSRSIQTFIYTTLKAFSEETDPETEEISKAAADVLKLVKPSLLPPAHHAHSYVVTNSLVKLQELMSTHITWNNGISGSNFYLRHFSRVAGFSRVGLEADFWVANPNAFVQGMLELFYPKEDSMTSRPPIPDLVHSTRWLKETLKIAPRTGAKLEGDFQIRMHRLIERMFIFNKGIFADLYKGGKRLAEQLNGGHEFHKQSMDNIRFEMSVTTDMGFPVSFRVDNPWLLSVTGGANLSVNSVEQFTADVTMMYATNLQSEVSFYTPFDNTQHVAAHYSQRLVAPPPLRLSVGLNSHGDGIKVSLWPLKAMQHPLSVFTEIDRPFTAQRDVFHFTTTGLSKNSKPVRAAFVASKEESFLEVFKVKYSRDMSNIEQASLTWDGWRPFSVFSHSVIWPELSAYNLDITLDYVPPITLEFGMGRASVRGGDLKIIHPKSLSKHLKYTFQQENTNVSNVTVAPVETTTLTLKDEQETVIKETTKAETTATTATTVPSADQETTEETPNNETQEEAETENVFSQRNEEVFKIYKIFKEDHSSAFNASNMDLLETEDNGSRVEYILKKTLSGMEGGNALAFGAVMSIMGPEPKKYGAYVGVGYDISQRSQRAGLFLVSQNGEKSYFGITAAMTSPASPVMKLKDILTGDLHSNLSMNIAYPEKEPIIIKAFMLRSDGKTSLAEKEPAKSCLENSYNLQPECREVARRSSTLDLYNLTFLSKELVHQISESFFINKILKRWYYPLITEEKVDGLSTADRANVALTVCPENDCIDALLRLPDRNIHFQHVPTKPGLVASFLSNPVFGPFSSLLEQSYCSLEGKKIVTFDEVMYDYQFGNCWHLLAKDCSGFSRIAVLTRYKNNSMELKVNVDNYRVLHLRPGPTADVNGQPVAIGVDQVAEVTDLNDASLMVITMSRDQAIDVKIPTHGFSILYGDAGVVITANRNYRGRLCGLCGDYDGEEMNEYRKAGGEVATSANEFALSYALKVGSCDRDNKSE